MGSQDVLREPSDDSQVLWSVVLSGAGVIFMGGVDEHTVLAAANGREA